MVAPALEYESNWAESYIFVNRLSRPFIWESLRNLIFSGPNGHSRNLQRAPLNYSFNSLLNLFIFYFSRFLYFFYTPFSTFSEQPGRDSDKPEKINISLLSGCYLWMLRDHKTFQVIKIETSLNLFPFFYFKGSEFSWFLIFHCLIDATAINRRREISDSLLAVAYEQYVTTKHFRW